MGWFSSSKRHKKSKSEHAAPPLPPRDQIAVTPVSHVPGQAQSQSQSQSQSLYKLPTASATTASVQTSHHPIHPYHHETSSSVHLSPSRPSPYRHRISSSVHLSPPSHASVSTSSLAKWQSKTTLSGMVSQTVGIADSTMTGLEQQMKEYMSCGVDAYGVMLRKLDNVITSMDEGLFTGRDEMVVEYPVQSDAAAHTSAESDKSCQSTALTFFSKVYLYTNARLPPQLSPLNLYPAGHALLRLAAQYSRNVYKRPSSNNPAYVDADWRNGTKAMVIKSLAVDDMKTVVIAIRGTQSFRDWAVNMKTAPTAPRGFLDDPFNLCHAGFLSVAQKMVPPVASRLRDLLAEDPNRANYSILITGHSAGGAVASLLYCHMFATTVGSELTHLRTFFRKVHCVTFGAPPVSLRPLCPFDPSSIFFSIVNEGDPVPRADKTYVSSLMNLYLSPAPVSRLYGRRRPSKPALWRIPPASLSVAGQVIVLRRKVYAAYPDAESVEACMTTDGVLRQAVFGDPLMHMMDLYARRIHGLSNQ